MRLNYSIFEIISFVFVISNSIKNTIIVITVVIDINNTTNVTSSIIPKLLSFLKDPIPFRYEFDSSFMTEWLLSCVDRAPINLAVCSKNAKICLAYSF